MHLSENGSNVIWAYVYGGMYEDFFHDVLQTSDGGYAVVGATVSFGYGNNTCKNGWLVKIASDGTLQWSYAYGGFRAACSGGYGSTGDGLWSVKQTSDNGFIMSGYTSSFTNGVMNNYLVKTDPSGSSGCNDMNITNVVVKTYSPIITKCSTTSYSNIITNPWKPSVAPQTSQSTQCFVLGTVPLTGPNTTVTGSSTGSSSSSSNTQPSTTTSTTTSTTQTSPSTTSTTQSTTTSTASSNTQTSTTSSNTQTSASTTSNTQTKTTSTTTSPSGSTPSSQSSSVPTESSESTRGCLYSYIIAFIIYLTL